MIFSKIKPKISIIIPTIGRKTLPNTLKSILNQTYQNLQIIVTDDTEEGIAKKIIEKFLKKDKRIKYVINRRYKHGPTGNKNNGLDFASGDYIVYCDDDDILLQQALEILLSVALNKKYDIVLANCTDNKNIKFTGKNYGKNEEVSYKDIICEKYEGEYTLMIKRNLIGRDKFFTKTWGGEHLLWWKLWKKTNKGFYINKSVRIYNIQTLDRVTFSYIKNIDRTLLNYLYTLENFEQDFIKYCPNAMIKWILMAICITKIGNKRKKAWKIYKRYVLKHFSLKAKFFSLVLLLLPKIIVKKLFIWKNLRKKIKKIVLKKYIKYPKNF